MKVWEILKEENVGNSYKVGTTIYHIGRMGADIVLLDKDYNIVSISNNILTKDFEEVTERDSGWYGDISKADKYYYIDADGKVEWTTYFNGISEFPYYKNLNTFTNREKAEEVAREQLLYRKMKKFRDENDEYVDWVRDDRHGYHIYVNSDSQSYYISDTCLTRHFHTIYFTTYELAKRCLDEVVMPFMKGDM